MQVSISIAGLPDNGDEDQAPDIPDVLDAAYLLAQRHPGGALALAARMGMSPNTLTHKLNPNNTTHHLTLREAVAMQTLAGDCAILQSMAHALGYTCVPATPDQSEGSPIDSITALQVQIADLMRAIADAVRDGDGAVTRNQMRRVDHHAQEAMAAIGHTVALVRGRMRPLPMERT